MGNPLRRTDGWADEYVASCDEERVERHWADLLRRREENKIRYWRPYKRQMEFYRLSGECRTTILLGGNQSGKTVTGSFKVAAHLTGLYPDWWPGRRYDRPIRFWAAGETSQATRDNVQTKLVGPPNEEENWGTGFLPRSCIRKVTRASHGVANAIDSVSVAHVSGKSSTLWFKSYEQGRGKWQGPTLDGIWFDEEPPWPIWSEGITRCNAVHDATIIATFTPLLGISDVVTYVLGLEDGEKERPKQKLELAA